MAAATSIELDPGIPALDTDPYADDVLADPEPFYAELRDAGPVVWLTAHGHYAVGRHAETRAVLEDWETFGSRRGRGLIDTETAVPLVETPEYARFAGNPRMTSPGMARLLDGAAIDPPEHVPFRRIFTRILAPQAVRGWRDQLMEAADALVAELVDHGSFDAATELADRFVLHALCDVVGLPQEGREHLVAYGNMSMNTSGPRNATYLDSIAEAEESVAWVDGVCGREALAPGGLGAQIYEAVDAGEIPEEAARQFVRVFPTAGMDTTSSTIANAIHALAIHPEQWRLLRDDPALARNAFQETMRWDQSIHPLYRTTTRATELAGVELAGNVKVAMFLASANRDPRAFAEPERFDITRRDLGNQLGFGAGIHACAGQMFARLEGEAVLTALARRVETLELDGEPTRRRHNTLHTWSRLPVRVTRP